MDEKIDIRKDLQAMQDLKYKVFHRALIPSVPEERIIGIRVPILRRYAKAIAKSDAAAELMQELPHTYYEENQLHAFLIECISDYDACIKALDAFLPFVDNWATCDSMSPRILASRRTQLEAQAYRWMARQEEYSVRFGIKTLMLHFLDEDFKEEQLNAVAELEREEYYIKMMQSWYFATALAKQYDATIKLFEERRLNIWIHNRSIQKALESRRVSARAKQYLRSLKR